MKENFLPSTFRLRPDDLIHTLYTEVEPDFKKSTVSVEWGFTKQVVNKAQRVAKATADTYTSEHLTALGVRLQAIPGYYLMDSWSNPSLRTYHIKIKDGVGALKATLSNCNCKDFMKNMLACKHLYYVSKHHKLNIVEDPSTIYRVDWRQGPYGNVSASIDSTLSEHRTNSVSMPLAWPHGLVPAGVRLLELEERRTSRPGIELATSGTSGP